MPADAARLREPLESVFMQVPDDWRPLVAQWRATASGQALAAHVDRRVEEGAAVYPAAVLRALELTPLQSVRAVVVGQDPYHGAGQAHGLAFSVPDGVKAPPSLRNILTELARDVGCAPRSTDLSGWARQGVLLLNTSLTVEDGAPGSHARRGWELLTERLIEAVARRPVPCAYLLWGAHAQQFEPLVHANAHADGPAALVLKSNHPSPLSARRPPVPFLGNGHFGAAQRYLSAHGVSIDWCA